MAKPHLLQQLAKTRFQRLLSAQAIPPFMAIKSSMFWSSHQGQTRCSQRLYSTQFKLIDATWIQCHLWTITLICIITLGKDQCRCQCLHQQWANAQLRILSMLMGFLAIIQTCSALTVWQEIWLSTQQTHLCPQRSTALIYLLRLKAVLLQRALQLPSKMFVMLQHLLMAILGPLLSQSFNCMFLSTIRWSQLRLQGQCNAVQHYTRSLTQVLWLKCPQVL